MKTFRAVITPVIDFIISHCTGICLLYSRISYKLLKCDNRFLALKDRYLGKRCFIVSLGPSLTISDLDILAESHEFCFSMNKCYHLFNKTKWRPDCYFISDGRLNNKETQNAIIQMLSAGISVIYSRRDIKKMPQAAIYYKADYIDFISTHSMNQKYKEQGLIGRFSDNAGEKVYSAHSCVTSIIQVAYYMGFREIYLIGQDCGITQTLNHCEGINVEINPNQAAELARVINDFAVINEDIKRKNIPLCIFNCTRGGYLNVFERKTLEEVLEQK